MPASPFAQPSRIFPCLLLTAFLISTVPLLPRAADAPVPPRDRMSDTWVAMDGLGRQLPGNAECGNPREGKIVAMFYFLWLQPSMPDGPYDISRILKENPTNPQWAAPNAFHHWGEPEDGYYVSDDPYMIRKHCNMLVNAGVDVIVFDVTNGPTYPESYLRLCETFQAIRAEGERTPQISFITNTQHAGVVQELYNSFYAKNLYPDLWFRWEGKPLLMASPEGHSPEIANFFTFRRSWAWTKGQEWFADGRDKWPWVDHFPQQAGWHENPQKPEEISVAVAQHPVSNIGRSFQNGKQPAPGQERTAEGLCFQEQWNRALEVNPAVAFVTGWNEWIAMRFVSDGRGQMLGKKIEKGQTFFVDQYNQEFSRDIEPMKEGHGDNYYYQLVANIRRFKGARPLPPASAPKTIAVDGQFNDWADVAPEFRDAIGDTAHRDHKGYGTIARYTDNTGRNDLLTLKVARDAENLYFYARTREPLTPWKDPNWMLLYLDVDANPKTGGWNGYEFLANTAPTAQNRSSVQKIGQGVVGEITFQAAGNELELAIPRKLLGLENQEKGTLDFHWTDNAQPLGDLTEFALHGDSAPDRRFNYRYVF